MHKFPCLTNIFVSAACAFALTSPAIANTQKVVYISPQGTDSADAGNADRPFRTITSAIAANPQSGTIFQLSNGTYSSASGENFPIRLPRGASLIGSQNGSTDGSIVINGGGRFVSSTFASQNIAIAAANDSRIEGITVTNSNPRGYGLWLESSRNVTIANNRFVGNTHDGILLTGIANAYIGNNLFAENRGSGISAVGSSTGEIRGNRFENTGFGLSIGQRSQVTVTSNNISRNVDGIIISNTAQPTLRGNTISDSQRNGVVVLSSSSGSPRPDLGTTNSLGNNVFRNNRESDINNATTIPIVAVGNQINAARVKGLLDLRASSSPAIATAPKPITPRPIASNPAPVFVPAQPPVQALPNPVISNGSNNAPVSIVIEREYTKPNNSGQVAVLPSALDPATGKALQYRVIVPASSNVVVRKVKTIVPSAFRLSRGGRTVMQVGAYSDRPTASQLVQKLAQAGVNAEIVSF
ncbi:MAG: hypothetical protein AUK48_01090 [Oscillatoriales cyanobacterium CG2_30_44_21]|nr:MAG: hypothetical protein AUK48_01090 [Oscillatoriales cyanobacterium CG2_30_44_21]